ncbi:hypothetical protein BJ170DRAFT_26410 [Xylariales sp. AK1849]|nr:hypothetical protein BJ170DRAFT_26410 [Xylariales sp. AK1849]
MEWRRFLWPEQVMRGCQSCCGGAKWLSIRELTQRIRMTVTFRIEEEVVKLYILVRVSGRRERNAQANKTSNLGSRDTVTRLEMFARHSLLRQSDDPQLTALSSLWLPRERKPCSLSDISLLCSAATRELPDSLGGNSGQGYGQSCEPLAIIVADPRAIHPTDTGSLSSLGDPEPNSNLATLVRKNDQTSYLGTYQVGRYCGRLALGGPPRAMAD